MNKQQLISKVAEKSGLNRTQSSEALNALVESISEELENGGDIVLIGFGTFSVKERSARSGRNPQTGESIDIPASKTVRFKAGKKFKERVNQ